MPTSTATMTRIRINTVYDSGGGHRLAGSVAGMTVADRQPKLMVLSGERGLGDAPRFVTMDSMLCVKRLHCKKSQ
jgi:hypothetical protein